jgi:hypothetical protein
MAIGIAVALEVGNIDPCNLYVQLKNKSVYKFNRRLTPTGTGELKLAIKSSRYRVQLRYWTKMM